MKASLNREKKIGSVTAAGRRSSTKKLQTNNEKKTKTNVDATWPESKKQEPDGYKRKDFDVQYSGCSIFPVLPCFQLSSAPVLKLFKLLASVPV